MFYTETGFLCFLLIASFSLSRGGILFFTKISDVFVISQNPLVHLVNHMTHDITLTAQVSHTPAHTCLNIQHSSDFNVNFILYKFSLISCK